MIGFVVAMQKEASLFLESVEVVEKRQLAGKSVFIGKCFDEDFVLIIGGIGKVNVALSTQLLIDNFYIDKVINFGVAGGKENSELTAGDVVLVDKVCQYDFDLSEIDDVSIGYMQDYDTIFYNTAYKNYTGNNFKIRSCATGDRFTTKEYFLNIIKDLGAKVVDMELGAIAQVCKANNKPLYSIKLISDVDGVEGSIFSQYQQNVKEVTTKIPSALKELITNLR